MFMLCQVFYLFWFVCFKWFCSKHPGTYIFTCSQANICILFVANALGAPPQVPLACLWDQQQLWWQCWHVLSLSPHVPGVLAWVSPHRLQSGWEKVAGTQCQQGSSSTNATKESMAKYLSFSVPWRDHSEKGSFLSYLLQKQNAGSHASRHIFCSSGFFFRQDKALKPKRIPGFKAQILVKQSFHVPQNPGASSKKHPTWETTLFMVGLLRKKFRLKIAN